MGKAGLPLWALSAALGLGIFLSFEISFPLQVVCIFAAISGLLLGLCWGFPKSVHPYGFLITAVVSFIGLGLLAGSLELPENQPAHFRHVQPLPDSSIPEMRISLSLEERRRPTPFSRPWIAKVYAANGQPASGLMLLQFPETSPDSLWLPGDKIFLKGIPNGFTPPKNPGDFDYGNYMRTQGIWYQVNIEERHYKQSPAKTDPLYKLSLWRRDLHHRLTNSGLNSRAAGLFSALLLGVRNELDPELRQEYQRSGTAHLLAISGLHVGLVLLLVRVFLKLLLGRFRFKGKRQFLYLTSLSALWIYTALAGFGASVVRASIMLSLWLVAEQHYRRGQSLHFLGLAAMVMLAVINPHWVLQPGFQLSFGAVWGILAFFPAVNGWLAAFVNRIASLGIPPPINTFLKKVGNLSAISVSAQLGVVPVALFHFHQFPWHFLAGSLVLVPFLGVMLTLGFSLLIASSFGPVPEGLIWLAETLVQGQNSLVSKLAAQEAFISTGIRWDSGHLLLSYLLLVGLALALRKPTTRTVRKTRINNKALQVALLATSALCLYDLQQEIRIGRGRELWIPQRTASSGLWIRNGKTLEPHAENQDNWGNTTTNYASALGLQIQETKSLQTAYRFGGKRLLRISGKEEAQAGLSGLTAIPGAPKTPLILLLSHSPKKIDSALLAALAPEMVIADGSNYYSALDRWETLCEKLKIPFHATARKGAFCIDLNTVASRRSASD
ncbi:competence protein ComEC [Robiginitalea myxolifaciens]|uniref:Competence protein ComEC n=1 Tax=Robiginitalea myxolifaciens TaxID=400055 RepID=A0A1I6GAV0_9FLAO|nr:ComEC/Rec2 family competence protein [Robiginitalea myxolifaciens]SFR39298.1 competence protein ComEC [Robiginitalea myxolifaciens]